jgi:hypothetical protein
LRGLLKFYGRSAAAHLCPLGRWIDGDELAACGIEQGHPSHTHAPLLEAARQAFIDAAREAGILIGEAPLRG